jgi:hypothetical protein
MPAEWILHRTSHVVDQLRDLRRRSTRRRPAAIADSLVPQCSVGRAISLAMSRARWGKRSRSARNEMARSVLGNRCSRVTAPRVTRSTRSSSVYVQVQRGGSSSRPDHKPPSAVAVPLVNRWFIFRSYGYMLVVRCALGLLGHRTRCRSDALPVRGPWRRSSAKVFRRRVQPEA